MASLFPKTGPRWTTSSVTTYRITTGTQQKYQKYVSMYSICWVLTTLNPLGDTTAALHQYRVHGKVSNFTKADVVSDTLQAYISK